MEEKDTTLNDYQRIANSTAIYPGKGKVDGVVYCALGLGEAGEVQNKVKKILRDHNGTIPPAVCQELVGELGDLLWYCAQMATELGINFDEVAGANIKKLKSRKERNTLQGSGDKR